VRLPTRQPIAGGRSRRPSSRSRGRLSLINRWRVAGSLLALASAVWFGWLLTNRLFNLDPSHVSITSLAYTSEGTIRSTIDLPVGATPNVFRIDARAMEKALEALPAVADAEVDVALPDRLTIRVTERTATFVLATPAGSFLVDVDGFVLDELPADDAAALGLPVVSDSRDQFLPLIEVGGRLDEVSLEADIRLAAITPALIGTQYPSLVVTVDDGDGYVLEAEPDGWRAIFGHYTPNLRPVDIVDRQVQCLKARVAAGESDIAVIYLSPLDDRCGTFLPRATPAESASPTEPT
jgi:cell division septal protein FtsQ